MSDSWWERFTKHLHSQSAKDGHDGSALFEIEREQRRVHGRLRGPSGGHTTRFAHGLDETTVAGDPEVAADDVYRRWRGEMDAQAGGSRQTDGAS